MTFVPHTDGQATIQVQVEGLPVPAEVILDLSEDGRFLGMEVLGASVVFPGWLLEDFDRIDQTT